MKALKSILLIAVVVFGMASCNVYNRSMKEATSYVEFKAEDFTLSPQVTGEATVTRVLGIDWSKIFGSIEEGDARGILDISIVGSPISPYRDSKEALYDMMKKNPGYDVVFYPQYQVEKKAPILGTDLYSKTTIKATARLGKLK